MKMQKEHRVNEIEMKSEGFEDVSIFNVSHT